MSSDLYNGDGDELAASSPFRNAIPLADKLFENDALSNKTMTIYSKLGAGKTGSESSVFLASICTLMGAISEKRARSPLDSSPGRFKGFGEPSGSASHRSKHSSMSQATVSNLELEVRSLVKDMGKMKKEMGITTKELGNIK